jgi:hypothetical protein
MENKDCCKEIITETIIEITHNQVIIKVTA